MHILAIGNSFSEDAARYLHDIARAAGKVLHVTNLCIGGCTLENHYRKMLGDARAHELQYDGHATGFYVSIREALLTRPWDVVTLQQASPYSFKPDSYTPYIEAIAACVREYCPKARLLIHQTWAYEEGSTRLTDRGFSCADAMLAEVVKAYAAAAELIRADGIIPAGELFGRMCAAGVVQIHRDTFHAKYGIGRYALGLLWYRMLTGESVADNPFADFDEPISPEEIRIAKTCVDGFAPI